MDDTIHGQKSRAAEHDVDALAERLIEVAGSKGEARRAIERAKAKGKKGRRRAFIKKIVGLCWPLPPTPKLSLGKDLIGCGNLGGANDNATVVDRLVARKSLWAALENEEGARRVFAEARRSRNGVATGICIDGSAVRVYAPPMELFLALQRDKPDLELLPRTRREKMHCI